MKPHKSLAALFMGLALLALTSVAVHAQDAGVVKSIKILEALTRKDIVLDRAGSSASGSPSARSMAIDLQVQFAFNSADLQPQGRQQLDELALALGDKALVTEGFEVIGHTDRVGSFDYNVQLSMSRAAAVHDYLITRHAISAARLVTAGMGFSRLADPANPTAAINRRVEIRRVPVLTGSIDAALVSGCRLVATPQ